MLLPDFIEYLNGKNNDIKSLRQLAIYDKEKDKYIETVIESFTWKNIKYKTKLL